MLSKEMASVDSSPKALKKFGLTLGILFGAIDILAFWRGHHAVFFLCVSLFFLVPAVLFPAFLKPVQKIWMMAGFLMGSVMNRVILMLIYFVFMLPIALIARLCGTNFMRPFKYEKDSYWIPSTITPADKTSYKNQF